MGWYNFRPYVSVAQKKAKAEKLIRKLRQERPNLRPVCLTGRTIAQSFWGQAWCKHLETYADHENRIGRGRSYVRNSAVCHLEAAAGRLSALVAGSYGDLYEVNVTVKPLGKNRWREIKEVGSGRVASMLDLLSGQFPKDLMQRVSDPENGLFPRLRELKFNCSCPDWAQMCKHVAAVLYAFGHRLDQEPELIFLLRGVDPGELISLADLAESVTAGAASALPDSALADIFGIELDLASPPSKSPRPKRAAPRNKRAGTAAQAAGRQAPLFRNPERPEGREIAALRKLLKLKPLQFAERLGLSLATALRWEKEEAPTLRQKSKDKLRALAAEVKSRTTL